ncbi:SCO1431 family membrane protein [Streptomyces sp. NPDC005438]
MSDALAARLTALGTGGPKDDREEWFQHLLGWSLTVLVAVLVTRLGLM